MEQSFLKVMRGIGEALKLDDEQNHQAAYIQYVECILSIASNLLQNVRRNGEEVIVTAYVEKQIMLGKQCMDRISTLFHEFNKEDVIKNEIEFEKSGGISRFAAPVPPLQNQPSSGSFSLKRNLSPTEIAYFQNESLMRAYKARLATMSKNNPMAANLSLTVQRKLAENLAIANAQERALSDKMKETQRRLDEQAARRFMSPIGMSEEEQEQRQIYKKILEYEQQAKWLLEWRIKLANSPKNPIVISQLVTQIIRCKDHPLTKLLMKYQHKIYEKLYPLVATKMATVNEISVPLPDSFHLKSPSVLEDFNECSCDSKEKNNGNDKLDSDKDDEKLIILNYKQDNDNDKLHSVSYTHDQENDNLGKVNDKHDKDNDNRGKVNDKHDKDNDELGSVNYTQDQDNDHDKLSIVNYTQDQDNDHDKLVKVNDKHDKDNDELDSVNYTQDQDNDHDKLGRQNDKDNDKLGSVNYTQDQDNDHDKLGRENDQDNDELGSVNYTQDQDNDHDKLGSVNYKQDNDFVSDMKGENSMVSDIVNITVNDSKHHEYSEQFVNIHRNHLENFTENTIKDLKNAVDQNVKLTEQLSMDNKQINNSVHSLSREFERYSEENMDDLFDDDDEVESLAEKPELDKIQFNLQRQDSEAYVVLSSNDVDGNNKFRDNLYKFRRPSEIMSEEAYVRHLKGVSQDIHNALEKLLVMFSIGYEELGSAEGRDQCYASIEEPFFKPIWKYLLNLFRLSNRTEETALAFCMTIKKSDLPESYGVSRKLCLASDIDGALPFQSAINEIRRLKDHYTMLSKLECVVNVCRLICDCVENFYTTKQIEDGEISSTPCVGADDLLPILTYVVIKSGLPQLLSECQAMAEFIHEGYIMGEEGYCLTSVQTAISFLSSPEVKNR